MMRRLAACALAALALSSAAALAAGSGQPLPRAEGRLDLVAFPGYAEDVILALTRSGQYDLVVIGTHGRTGFKRLWLGSVAERVSRHSAIPVVMVRAPRTGSESD